MYAVCVRKDERKARLDKAYNFWFLRYTKTSQCQRSTESRSKARTRFSEAVDVVQQEYS